MPDISEVAVILGCASSARFIPSDRPGSIALEIRSEVSCQVSLEAEIENLPTTAGVVSDSETVTETYTRRTVYRKVCYFPIWQVKEAIDAVLYPPPPPSPVPDPPSAFGKALRLRPGHICMVGESHPELWVPHPGHAKVYPLPDLDRFNS